MTRPTEAKADLPDLAGLARAHGLTPVGVRPPLRTYLATLWQRRHFATRLAVSRSYARNQGSYLGQLWALLNPVLWAAVYFLVFGVMLDTSRGVDNFLGFLVVGIFMFRFSSAAITAGSNSIVGNRGLITSLQFPRALLPLSTVLAELFTLLPAVLVMLVIVPFTGEPITPAWLLLPPALALQWLFGTGIALICARLVSQFRDVKQLIPFVLRALMYASGVMFSIDHYVGDGAAAQALSHQPIAVYLEIIRGVVLSESTVSADVWLWGAGWAVGTMAVGLVFFWRAEERYGRG